MTRERHIARVNTEIAADLARNGLTNVHVDVDEMDIAYVTGKVASQDAEADAVRVVLQHGVGQVQDGLEYPGQTDTDPELSRPGAIGPLAHEHARSADAAKRILGAGHLEGRVFDGRSSESSLETGTPLITVGRA